MSQNDQRALNIMEQNLIGSVYHEKTPVRLREQQASSRDQTLDTQEIPSEGRYLA